jgi:16S rRNA (guanine966-N2)-methyltransferase
MGELRIIAGQFRRRRIAAPPTDRTRPITDRVRESLFGRLGERLEGASVLDCFAGGGTMGLEALSRGARHAVFIELAPLALRALRENIAALGVADRTNVLRADVLKGLPRAPLGEAGPFEMVFFDPPYAMWDRSATAGRLAGVIEKLAAEKLLAPGAVLVVRTDARSTIPQPAGLTLVDRRRYGTMLLWWLEFSSELGVRSWE